MTLSPEKLLCKHSNGKVGQEYFEQAAWCEHTPMAAVGWMTLMLTLQFKWPKLQII